MMSASKAVLAMMFVGVALTGCSDKKEAPAALKTEVAQPAQPVAPAVQVINWGPKGAVVGQGFSVQKNGNSAIWFEARGIGNANMVEVWFGDRKLDGMAIIPNEGGSAEVPAELLAKVGKFPIYLLMKPEGTRVELGTFEVAEKP